MKDQIIVGDTLDFSVSVPAFPPADGWTLKYRLVPRAVGGAVIEITATDDGTNYLVQVAPATTVAWLPGEYGWNSWVEKVGARFTVDSGLVTLEVDPATLPVGADTRSHARKMLASIEAALEAFAVDNTVKSYTITTGTGSRSVTRSDVPELIVLRDRYRTEVVNEEAVTGAAAQLGINPRYIGIRFRNV